MITHKVTARAYEGNARYTAEQISKLIDASGEAEVLLIVSAKLEAAGYYPTAIERVQP